MLNAFIDESYSDDWFFMAATIGDDRVCTTLANNLEWTLLEAAHDHDLGTVRELHGFELFQGRGPWKAVRGVNDRLGVAGKALQDASNSGVKVIVRGIDRAAQRFRYPEAYEPYPLILTHTIRAIDQYATAMGERVRITCDEIHHDDRHRAMLERHRLRGTPGYTRSKLSAVDGDLEFISSHESSMVQMADLIAYLRHRAASRPSAGSQELRARRRLWGLVEPMMVHEFLWKP